MSVRSLDVDLLMLIVCQECHEACECGWENIPSIAATTTCFSVRQTQRDKFRVLPSLPSFAQVRIVPQSMASATGSSTLRQVSIFTYSLHFFDFVPSSRSISSTPRRVERPQTQVLPSQPFRRVKRTTPSAPHCLTFFCPFANIERSSPEASVCSDVSNVACVNWRPPRGKGCTF